MKKLNFTNLNMLDMYKDGIERGKDDTFAIFQRANGKREEYTYNDISKEANLLLEKLIIAGLKKGDRIAVISSLRPMWYAITYACLKGGFIMVCIDPGIPYNQTKKMMLETDVRAVFTSLKQIYLPKELNNHIPVFFIETSFPLMNACKNVNFLLDDAKEFPEDTFFVLFSSGTTGENRKAVLLKHSTVTLGIEYGMSNDTGVYRKTSVYTPNKCDLMLFPPYHIAGLLCATYDIYCNTKVIMLERLTPNGLISALQELKPDNICTVPSMLTSLYKKIKANYTKKFFTKIYVNTSLAISGFLRKYFGINSGKLLLKPLNKEAFGGNVKSFMIGASPIDEETNRFYLNMGINVNMAYGLTELGAPLAATGKGYYPGTAGRVLRHTSKMDIRIVHKDETGKGEVEVLSPYRMISYMKKKDNQGCFTEDGYFRTGDLGYFDKNKCLVICGRIKESIVLKNGEKLLPEEIESKYQNLHAIAELVAFKVPGEGGCDEFSIAIVKDKNKGIPDEATKVRVYERAEKLPQMYRPKDVYIVKEFPLSSSHKVQRFRLTQMVLNGESEPITDSLLIPIDEDKTTSELRKILVAVGGQQWKNQKLTEGLLLNLDSLSVVNLYVAIQEKWGIDLFQTSTTPETFGELLDTVRNFDEVEKNEKNSLDLSKYPLPSTPLGRFTSNSLEKFVKFLWRVKSEGIENLPKDTNYILCSNHRSDIDPAFISSCLPKEVMKKTCIVGKADLTNNKAIKQLITSHNFIPIDRTGNSIQTLDRCKELLLEGYNILIFPEGTSVMNSTKLLPLKEGPARLSIATNKPIVPVHIVGITHNDKEMSDKLDLPPLKGDNDIVIKFGKAITPDNMTVKELNEILSQKIQDL